MAVKKQNSHLPHPSVSRFGCSILLYPLRKMQINQDTNQNFVFGEKRKPGNLTKNQRSPEKNLPGQGRAAYGVETKIEPRPHRWKRGEGERVLQPLRQPYSSESLFKIISFISHRGSLMRERTLIRIPHQCLLLHHPHLPNPLPGDKSN